MALADFQVESGDIAAGLETCETLLGIASADDLAPEEDLADAAEVSYLYATVAAIQASAGKTEAPRRCEARRKALWQHWSGQAPGRRVRSNETRHTRAQIAATPARAKKQRPALAVSSRHFRFIE